MKTFKMFPKFTQFLTISVLLITAVVSRAATVVQSSGSSYISFESDTLASITNAPPTTWVVTNDATASGSLAIYQAGVNQTASSSSFVLYSLKFSQAGTYSIYYRWRADKGHTDSDPTSANSFRVPIDFGDLANDPLNFPTATVNNAVPVPAANSYNVFKDNQTYTVSQAQVDAGIPLILKIGTREAGMFIDRFVLSTNNAMILPADFDALPDSGSSARPQVLSAVGSAGLTNVTVTFDKPLISSSTNTANFTLSGGLGVQGAILDTNTSKDIILTTTLQVPGSNYIITVNGVTDVNGNQVLANSTVHFTSWKLSAGWVTRELYFNVDTNLAGGGVLDLLADPKYPN